MAKKIERPHLGEIKSFTFDNGSSVYIRENHNAPVVNIQAWVKNGSINEDKNIGCGLSHFLEHMVFQGTKNFSGSKIMQLVHQNGGEINAYTSFSCTVYYIELLSSAFNKGLDILADMVTAPLFPENDFKTEKNVILRERSMIQDSPDRILGEKLWQTIFQHHPVRHPIIGYADKIETVDSEMMTDFFRQRYTPERIFFVISGDVKAEKIIDQLQKQIGDLNRGNLHEPYIPPEPPQQEQRFHSSFFEDPVARLAIGYRIPPATNQDIPALNMLSAILGSSKSSRLISYLRDKKQLALNIDAFSYNSNFDGVLAVSACCLPENREKLTKAIYSEIEKTTKTINQNELERVRKQTITGLYRGLKSNGGVARIIGNSILNYGTPEYAYKYIDDISKLTAEDLKKASKKYLGKEKSSYVELIPPKAAPLAIAAVSKFEEKIDKPLQPSLIKMPLKVRMVHWENNSLPLVDICLIIPGGGIFENTTNAGITRMTSAMLQTATKSFSEEKLASMLDNNAINCSISGGNNTLCVRLNCHRENLNIAIKALQSILGEPKFSKTHFDREKKVLIEALKTRKLEPQRAAEDALCQELYGDHPYAVPVAGLESSVAAMKIADIKKFYEKNCLISEKCVIGFAGAITKSQAEICTKALIKAIPWNTNPLPHEINHPQFPSNAVNKKIIVPREQAVVMLGLPGCENTSPDRFAMDILQTSLNGMETRLFKSIRDRAGLAYYTGLYSSRGIHKGFLAFYAGTNPENSEKVIAMFHKEKNKLVKTGLNKKEFSSTLARLEGNIAQQQLNTGEMIFGSALSEFYGNGYLEQWQLLQKYEDISREEVNQLIKKYLSTKATVSITAGP